MAVKCTSTVEACAIVTHNWEADVVAFWVARSLKCSHSEKKFWYWSQFLEKILSLKHD